MEVSILKELINKTPKSSNNLEAKNPNIRSSQQVVQCKSKKSIPNGGGYGTGKRKNSIARVWIRPGKGIVTVNNKSFIQYFSREAYRIAITKPFIDTNTNTQYDVVCKTRGGGLSGQAGAITHGIAKALDCISDDFHSILSKKGFLTRDSRVVERKKYGRRKARKSTQFSKR